jgi:hypothetical protein
MQIIVAEIGEPVTADDVAEIDARFRERLKGRDGAALRRTYYGWFLPALTDRQYQQLAPRGIRELCDALGITGTISAK